MTSLTPDLSFSSSSTGLWERVLDLSQYPILHEYIENGYSADTLKLSYFNHNHPDYVEEYRPNDKQSITFTQDVAGTDSQRIQVVFDFTEYSDCTITPSTHDIIVKFTAVQPTGTDRLEVRSTTAITQFVQPTATATEYTTTLSAYQMTDGFVYVWFRTDNFTSAPDIAISNITARIKAKGRTKLSITPVQSREVSVTQPFAVPFPDYVRNTTLKFDDLDLSIWPSNLQSDTYKLNSIVSFMGVLDIDRSNPITRPGRAQATESNNDSAPVTSLELAKTSQFQYADDISTIVGGSLSGVVSFDPDVYEATGTVTIPVDEPVITYNRLSTTGLETQTRTDLQGVSLSLANINPAKGEFENAFVKTKVLLDVARTYGDIDLDTTITTAITPQLFIQPTVNASITATLTASAVVDMSVRATLTGTFNLDTSGRIHVFVPPSATFTSQFTATADAFVSRRASPSFTASFGKTVSPTMLRIAPDTTTTGTFTTTAIPTMTLSGVATLNTAFTTTAAPFLTIKAPNITATGTFATLVDGDIEINSGLVDLSIVSTTTASAQMFRKDSSLDTLTITSTFDTTTGRIHLFNFPATTFTGNLTMTPDVHLKLVGAPATIASQFTFDTTTGRIHLFNFPATTFTLASTFDTTTGRIHLFNFPDTTLTANTTFTAVGGIQHLGTMSNTIDATISAAPPNVFKVVSVDLTAALTTTVTAITLLKKGFIQKVKEQSRVFEVQAHPRTIEANRILATETSSANTWLGAVAWKNFNDWTTIIDETHLGVNAVNRTISVAQQNRTYTPTEKDTQQQNDIQTKIYTIPTTNRSIAVENTTRSISAVQNRTITADTITRTISSEIL